MKSHTIAPAECKFIRVGPGWTKRLLPLALAVLASPTCLLAQGATPAVEADKQTIQMLLQRIEKLEARVSQLEGTQAHDGQGADREREYPGSAASTVRTGCESRGGTRHFNHGAGAVVGP